jgi:hypothetical protein
MSREDRQRTTNNKKQEEREQGMGKIKIEEEVWYDRDVS